MKFFIKMVMTIIVMLIILYYSSMFVMPSITVVNHSGTAIDRLSITLPNSNLDFGSIEDKQENTIHYSLSQKDGTYNYKFEDANSTVHEGSCGYLTNSEIHKRVVITIDTHNQVMCSS